MTVSMKLVTILQLIGVFVIYFGMTVLIPALIFHKKLKKERFMVRFLAYYLMGNFYMMNLVFVLQLLHISNRWTLLLFTVVPAAWAGIRFNDLDVRACVLELLEFIRRFLEGTIGLRLLVSNVCRGIVGGLRNAAQSRIQNRRAVIVEWVVAFVSMALVLWLYGTNLLNNYGYCASDIPVHNYWINELGNNNIFAAGIYPYGFHCVLYYLHEVFGFKTFVLLRLFCLVQVLMVHLVMLAFLKLVCRTQFMPYLAFALYVLGNFWNRDVLTRYCSSLPQEFGMIFILPAALFLILFFSERKKEEGQRGIRVHSTWYLLWFGMSFSMTLAVHFYNTMIIGLFCVGIAVGYVGLLFRRAYFGRIMLAGILSVLVAVLPMGVAYAMGTPLQGSLKWGMGIIESSTNTGTQMPGAADTPGNVDTAPTAPEPSVGEDISSQGGEAAAAPAPVETAEPTFRERMAQMGTRLAGLVVGLQHMVYSFCLSRIQLPSVTLWLLTVPILAVLGGVCCLMKNSRMYGCALISVSVFLMLLFVLLMSTWIGIPSLMDAGRCSIYLSYSLCVAVTLCADALVSLLLGKIPRTWVMNGVSLAGVAVLAVWILASGNAKSPFLITALETNGAITCLTDILREESNWKFTICSANDEFRMMEDYGYHYETITFLRDMEGSKREGYLTIPTPRIYFFIEKIPVNYTELYEGSGRTVSEEGAAQPLPGGGGISMYKGERRYILMSRMYYWAKAFQELYPNEMRVYFETDEFVCYVVEQNPYRLFDLSIDYGYNVQ